jgi:hypothetical protein
MRAFVRVLPLLVVAAHVAACAASDAARENPGAVRYAAATRPVPPVARNATAERPDQALLARQPSPRCERSKPLEGVPSDQARAAMLDYEQQCYRQLAQLEHARLVALQDSAAKTRSFASAHQALLERQPPPSCEPAQAATGLGPAEAREATLDAQRQCYKQHEASERQELGALQDALRKSVNGARSQRGSARRTQRERYLTY